MISSLNFVALDFETANRARNSACQIGMVKVEDGQVVNQLSLLIRPPDDWFEFTYIHGLRWEDVGDQPNFKAHWPQIEAFMQGADFLAAHNSPFDKGVMNKCCEHIGKKLPSYPWVDTVKVARKVWDIHPTKLNNVCDFLQVELNHHEALSDAQACAGILLRAWQTGWRPEISSK